MTLHALTIFLSAFLLFQVQPIIARILLPWFGGTAAVWTTCMLFFQCVLVLGYLYAHWTTRKLGARQQAILHGCLLLAGCLALPITPSEAWKPTSPEDPTLRILGLLVVSVGLPYFLLSTTGPLLQAWYFRAHKGAVPYRLFALSNLASMLGLLTYPVLVEPALATRTQAWSWSVLFAVFAVLCGITAFRSPGGPGRPVEGTSWGEASGSRPALLLQVLWFSLAACASTLLLAVTNHLCQDVASVPFLWILPLSLYLLTFILCFDAKGWYRREVFVLLLIAALGAMTYMVQGTWERPPLQLVIPLFAMSFFVCCMFCHGELARLKPHPRYLTSFYLMISLGGAAGGLVVGIVAPWAFPTYLEFPIALSLCAVLAAVILHRDESVADAWVWQQKPPAVFILVATTIVIFNAISIRDSLGGYLFTGRNFHGALRVRQTGDLPDESAFRTLLHGGINHGEQWLHPQLRMSPNTYYCGESGIGQALALRAHRGPRRVGVIGLGTGTLAVYGKPGDMFRIYEINPLVLTVSKTYFTYIKETPAKVDVVLGDARQSLEREAPQNFDVLAVDAFSGDSIPVHLLTREAFDLYFRHLKPDGLLAVHVSNRALDLVPVVDVAAQNLRKAAVLVDTKDSGEGNCYGATWVILANRASDIANLPRHNGTPLRQKPGLRMFTDDYSNLFQILK